MTTLRFEKEPGIEGDAWSGDWIVYLGGHRIGVTYRRGHANWSVIPTDEHGGLLLGMSGRGSQPTRQRAGAMLAEMHRKHAAGVRLGL